MGKVKKATATSSLGRSLVKDKSRRNRGKAKEDGWVTNTYFIKRILIIFTTIASY